MEDKKILEFIFALGFIERKYSTLADWEKPADYEKYKNGEIKYLKYINSIFECNISIHYFYNSISFNFYPKKDTPIIERIKFIGDGYYKFIPQGNEPFSYSNYLNDYQRTSLMFKFYFKHEIRKMKIKNILK